MAHKYTTEQVWEWMDARGAWFYANPDDTNLFVRKRYAYRYTINCANPRAWVALAGFVVLLLGIAWLIG